MLGRRLLFLAVLYPTLLWAAIPSTVQELNEHAFAEVLGEISKAGAEANSTLSLLAELNGEGNTVESAAKKLALQPDENILFALLMRIEHEFLSKNPRGRVAESLFRVVGSIASNKYDSVLRSFREQLDDRSLALRSDRRYLRKAIEIALVQIKMRTEIGQMSPLAASPLEASSLPSGMRSFKEYLIKSASEHAKRNGRMAKNDQPDTPEGFVLAATSQILTDEIRRERAAGIDKAFVGREEEREQLRNIMLRSKTKMPVLVGPSGVGKSTVAYMFAEDIYDGHIPDSEVFREQFQNAEVIETSPARISQLALSNEPTAQAAALEMFFDDVRRTEENYRERTGQMKPIIVLIDNVQSFDPPQMAALMQVLENNKAQVRAFGTALSEALDQKTKITPGMAKVFEKVPVREYTIEETRARIVETWLPEFKKKFSVEFDSSALDAVFRVSKFLKPNSALPEAPIRALEDYAIFIHAKNPKDNVLVNGRMIYDYAQKITGLPVNPLDATGFAQYIDKVREKLSQRVVNQEPMIKVAVDALERVLTGDPRRPVSVLFEGPTGVGKTLVGQSLAEFAFNDKNRFLEIDGTALQDGKFSLSSIFGVPTGVKGADVTSGELMEWLDDPSRGKYGGVILINEADKMHLDGWKRLMEFLDRGAVPGGDGKMRYGNRHIVIFTSNKGTKKIFPDSFVNWSDAEIAARAATISPEFLKNLLLERDLEPSKNEVILSPEIVGRINLAALALPVTKSMAPKITEIETKEFLKSFKATYDVNVEVSPELNAQLGLTGINFLSGARNIRNQVSEYLTPALTAARKKWSLTGGQVLKLSLESAKPGESPKIVIEFNHEKIKSVAPQIVHENPLEDPAVREMLAHLSEKMHAHMPEQPEAVDIIVSAVLGKYGDVNRKRPISIGVVGRTGLGKTELGKALAYAVYNNTERYSAIPMSDVVNDATWDKVFIPQFEQALMSNPQGGVIIPDEFSNVGGGNLTQKKALLLKFLHLLEEGVWTSPVDPTRVYDLRKYIFLFTGNDLETLTQGITSDEENLNVWADNNSRAKVEAHLKANGVPESFLGRLDAVLMIKPLTGEGKGRVSERILVEISQRLMKQHKGVKISWDEPFTSQMGHSFFTHARGARSVRSVLENTVASMVTEILTKFGYDQKNLDGVEVRFSISDNAVTAPYVKGGEAPKRAVILTAELFKGGERREVLSVDATDKAEPVEVLTEAEANLASYHELGHAFLNNEELTGLRLDRISIRGRLINGERVIGYNKYVPTRVAAGNLTRRGVIAHLKMLWGGRLAQEKAGFDPDSGWESDLATMRQIATDYFKKYGLNEGLESMALDAHGRPSPSREQALEMQNEMKQLFKEAREAAEKDLADAWPELQRAQIELKERGDITGVELQTRFKLKGGSVTSCSAELK